MTVITDDPPAPGDDSSDVGSPQQWYESVVAAKHGDASAVVMLGLIPSGELPRHTTPRFVELVELFGEQGVLGNIRHDDYGPFFEDAVSKIDFTCDNFVPAG